MGTGCRHCGSEYRRNPSCRSGPPPLDGRRRHRIDQGHHAVAAAIRSEAHSSPGSAIQPGFGECPLTPNSGHSSDLIKPHAKEDCHAGSECSSKPALCDDGEPDTDLRLGLRSSPRAVCSDKRGCNCDGNYYKCSWEGHRGSVRGAARRNSQEAARCRTAPEPPNNPYGGSRARHLWRR